MRTLARSCTECDTAGVVKVAFIGAGSVEFTRNVVTDLCGYPELAGGLDLALHDVSAERLAHAQRSGQPDRGADRLGRDRDRLGRPARGA